MLSGNACESTRCHCPSISTSQRIRPLSDGVGFGLVVLFNLVADRGDKVQPVTQPVAARIRRHQLHRICGIRFHSSSNFCAGSTGSNPKFTATGHEFTRSPSARPGSKRNIHRSERSELFYRLGSPRLHILFHSTPIELGAARDFLVSAELLIKTLAVTRHKFLGAKLAALGAL